jgi:hypothetical protein
MILCPIGADGQNGHRRPSAFRRLAPSRDGAAAAEVGAPISAARASLLVTARDGHGAAVCAAAAAAAAAAAVVAGAAGVALAAILPPVAALHSAAEEAPGATAAAASAAEVAGTRSAPPPKCRELAPAHSPAASPGSGISSAFSRVRPRHRAGALGPLARGTAAAAGGGGCGAGLTELPPRDAAAAHDDDDNADAAAPAAPLFDNLAVPVMRAAEEGPHEEMAAAVPALRAAAEVPRSASAEGLAPAAASASAVAAGAEAGARRPETSHGRRGLSRTCGAAAAAGGGLGATSAAEAASLCAGLGQRYCSRRGDADVGGRGEEARDVRSNGVHSAFEAGEAAPAGDRVVVAGTRSGATAAAARTRSVAAAPAQIEAAAGTGAAAEVGAVAPPGRVKMAPLPPHAIPAPTEFAPRHRPRLTALPAQDARHAYM